MRRLPLTKILAPIAALAVVGPVQATLPSTAQAAPAAPSPARTGAAGELDIPKAGTTVEVDGVKHTVLAQLAPTAREFTMAGITFEELTGTARFQVRVRTDAGWQEWQDLEYQPEAVSGDEEAARQGTEPSYLGEARAVEARVLTTVASPASISTPRLALVDSRERSSDAGLTAEVSGGVQAAATTSVGVARPAILTRSQWGADESLVALNGASCVPANLDTTIKAAIVHHTAGTNSYTSGQSASIVRGILAYHTKSLGWCDIGYNFLVDKYGTIYEGRHGGINNPVHGAHATSWNTNTVGISVMMNSSSARQTSAAMNSVARVLAWKLAGNYRDPNAKLTLAGKYINRIARHGDVMSTACPGTNITAYMPTLRKDVAAKMGNWRTPIYNEWAQQGGETGTLGSPFVLERPWLGGRTTTFTRGGIFMTPGQQTFWMGSAIDAKYRASGTFDKLGWPTRDQAAGTVGGSSVVRFQKGSIHHSAATGARLTVGAIDSWLRANPSQAAALGLPVADQVAESSSSGYQNFTNGVLRYSSGGVSIVTKDRKLGDVNGDDRADLLTLSGAGAVSWSPTSGSLTAGTRVAAGSVSGAPFTWALRVPDMNGDGSNELVAQRRDGTVWAWDGQGLDRFTNARRIGTGWNGLREVTYMPDMNGDGAPELVAIRKSDNVLFRYSLDKRLRVTSTTSIGHGWWGIKQVIGLGDITGDGASDILAVERGGRMLTYHGTGRGQLSGARTILNGGWQGYTEMRSVGDLNGDGRADLLAHNATGPVYRYVGLGGGRWATRGTLLGALPSGVTLA